jgi:hypothetical protein
MKHLLSIITLVSFIACKDKLKNENIHQGVPKNSTTVQLQLIDTLGTITFSVPIRYDTNFSWVRNSDCGKPCEEQEYRFQPKVFPITKESGWTLSGSSKDSVDRLTISHTRYFSFHNGDTAKNFVRHNHIKEELMSNPENPPIVSDTIQKINDKYYSIIVMEKSDTFQSKKIVGVTSINGNEVRFQYELVTKKNDSISINFINNTINLIKTIRISK